MNLRSHLGTTALTANASGTETGRLLYKPWGETRFSTGTTPTSHRFTGQREDAPIGLYFYNARYYDAALGRFTQPDTIVPQPGNPGSLNRYSYVLNNPLRYTDPTGHRECERYCSDEIITAGIASAYAGPWDPVAQARRMQTAQQAAGAAIDFTPVVGDAKGLVEVFTGSDLVTGERLGGWRWLGLLGLSEVRHLRHADELADVIHNVGKRTAGVSIESGTQVYRVWGKDPSNPDLIRQSGPWGPSWTTVDPSTVPDYRGYAGLPSGGESGALRACLIIQ